MSEFSLILLSAGVGKRMGQSTPKQLLLLAGRPMILHSILEAEKVAQIKEIIIPCPKDYLEQIKSVLEKYKIKTPIRCVVGGSTRQESVYIGTRNAQHENVIIHEAARPMVKKADFERLIQDPEDNVIYGIDIPFTVLFRKDSFVSGNINRGDIFNVQLPHKYKKETLLMAHKFAEENKKTYTEDAALVFEAGIKVKIMAGKSDNIKVTDRTDHQIVEALLRDSNEE